MLSVCLSVIYYLQNPLASYVCVLLDRHAILVTQSSFVGEERLLDKDRLTSHKNVSVGGEEPLNL